jgi:FlaA1/EpsC-like NDP-sugar epimerase
MLMKPVLFLRIASVLTFVHGALHGVNMIVSKPGPGAPQIAVAAMKANVFPLMGMTRSYWDFYMGMGLAGSITLVAEAIVLWQLSALARSNGLQVRPMVATFLVAYVALAANSYTYFFAPPVITELLIALCLGLAWKTSSALDLAR